ncbi:MAG: hypothetical protein PHT69_13975 [Bacteroidales bacterium]|nr:hypothetical protein [Bacteroidales bacterium]
MHQHMFKTGISIKCFLFILFCTFTIMLKAQINPNVTVVAPYEPSLSDANKISINPEIPETEIVRPDFRFNLSPVLYKTFFEPVKITPARLGGEPLSKLYQSYIKAGFGNYTTPFAELHYNNLRSRTFNSGVYFKHHSSSGKINDFAPANFSDNVLNVYGSRFFENHILKGELNYNRHVIHYYGFNPDVFLINDSLLEELTYQRYNIIQGSVALQSDYTDSEKLQHSIALDYYNFRDFSPIRENGLTFNASLRKSINLISLLDNERIVLNADVNYYNNAYLLSKNNTAIIEIKPQYRFNSNQYALNIGLNASIESSEDAFIHFFPIIEGQIAIARDVFTLYGELGGGIKKNNLNVLYKENPFINTSVPLDFSITKISAKGGVKGNIASSLSYNLGGAFAEVEKMPFFINDTSNIMRNKFTIAYYNANVINAFAGFTFQANDNLLLLLKGNFFYYEMSREAHPWHKPMYDASLDIKYTLVDKIVINGEVFTQSKTFAKIFDNQGMEESVEIKAFTDLNLGIEYLYTKRLSAFVSFNNITAQRYYRWYNYPTQKFHFLAGLTYGF